MPLIINNFHQGQSFSPYTSDGAFAKSQNLDVFSQLGIARINYLPTACAGTFLDLPVCLVRASNSTTTIYMSDDSGNVFSANSSLTTPDFSTTYTDTTGKYIIHWKGYLLGANTTALEYWNTPNFTTFGSALTSTPEHFIFESKNDGKLYICAGRYISTLEENAGQNFDPSNGATFTHTAAAFTLPENYQAIGLSEMGSYIVIAAIPIPGTLIYTMPETYFFIWDRANTTADNIISIPEANMTTLKSIGNRIYISGGEQGKIYVFSESGLEPYCQIPFDLSNNLSIEIGLYGHSSLIFWQDKFLAGVSSDDGLYPAGVYGIKDKRICHEFLPTEGYDGSTKDIRIGGMLPLDNNSFMFGWENNTDGTWGIGKVSTSNNRQTSYTSYFESIFYPVGLRGQKKSFDKVEVQLSRPLQTGEGVRIKYRKNINDSWTTLGTQTYTTNGAVSSLEFAGIHNLENLQLRVELTTGATVNTPYVLEIRCLP